MPTFICIKKVRGRILDHEINFIFVGSQKDDNWLLPVMYVVCLDLRLFAIQADKQKRSSGKGKPGEFYFINQVLQHCKLRVDLALMCVEKILNIYC